MTQEQIQVRVSGRVEPPERTEMIFRLDDVHVHYGGFLALRGVNLEINRNEITAFIGPSGCGKSTPIRCLNRMNDLIPGARVEGRIEYHGQDLYGDGVDPAHRHRDMWAVKGHYFTAYYNWPYTFGLLFGIGLYAEFQRDPERFRAGYDDLLSATGLGDAATLAARFGIDVRDEAFWTASLDVLRGRIDEFVAAAA